jgi:rRNA-processing protein FCF1
MMQLLQNAEPQTMREIFIAAGSIIVLGVATQIMNCVVRQLQRIEAKLDRNTRETVAAHRDAERAANNTRNTEAPR